MEQLDGRGQADCHSLRVSFRRSVNSYPRDDSEILGLLVDYAAARRDRYDRTRELRGAFLAHRACIAACDLYHAAVVCAMFDEGIPSLPSGRSRGADPTL